MVDYGRIDKKLEFAGLSSVTADNYMKLKRTAQVLMRASTEQADYIIERICRVNPYVAAECVFDTKNPRTYRKMILDAAEAADIPGLLKAVLYYRFDCPEEYCALVGNTGRELAEYDAPEKLFKSWRDFCLFAGWVLREEGSEWICPLVKAKEVPVSSLCQNEKESQDLVKALLEKKYYTCVRHIYDQIGIDNFYTLFGCKYEEIEGIFTDGEPVPVPAAPETADEAEDPGQTIQATSLNRPTIMEQMKYCYIDSLKRGINLFSRFHQNYDLINLNRYAWFVALMYEYQVASEEDEEFWARCEQDASWVHSIREAGTNMPWRKPILENLIACTRKCIKEQRDFSRFMQIVAPVNLFSDGSFVGLWIDVIDEEKIKIDAGEARSLFQEFCQSSGNAEEIMELYLNSYLKLFITLDSAVHFAADYDRQVSLSRFLQEKAFSVRIYFTDATNIIVRTSHLLSRVYTVGRDKFAFGNLQRDDRVYAKFKVNEAGALFIDSMQEEKDAFSGSGDYRIAFENSLDLIKKIAGGEYTQGDFDNLAYFSKVPMVCVKNNFDRFLDSLELVEDDFAFMKIIAYLTWNREYWYKDMASGRIHLSYESSEFIFYATYTGRLNQIFANICRKGLSAQNALSLYMNSFFKLALSLDYLHCIDWEEAKPLFDRYVFVGRYRVNHSLGLVSVKNIHWKGGAYPVPDYPRYYDLDENVFRLRLENGQLQFVFDREETDRLILTDRVERLRRAYLSISKKTYIKPFEYDYIKKVSPYFLGELGPENCRFIARCTVEATQIRHESYEWMIRMLKMLGPYNIFGADFYPIIFRNEFLTGSVSYTVLSGFAENFEGEYKMAARMGHAFVRICSKLSDAFFLYFNTYVKNRLAIVDFAEMCLESDMEKDACLFTDIAVIHINRMVTSGYTLNYIDISVKEIPGFRNKYEFKELPDLQTGKYYAKIEIKYAGKLSGRILSILDPDRRELVVF